MDKKDINLGLNRNMTDEQRKKALELLTTQIETMHTRHSECMCELYEWYQDIIIEIAIGNSAIPMHNRAAFYDMLIDLAMIDILIGTYAKQLHFLVHNEYPMEAKENEQA